MAFEEIIPEEDTVAKVIAAEDIYRDDRGKLVPAGSAARVLIARAGREIDPQYEDQITPGGKIKRPKAKAKKPAANKRRKQGDDK